MEKSKENKKSNKSVTQNNKSSGNKINKRYKDSFFINLFSDKQSIIDLYNAIKGTNYTYNTPIDVITLEGIAYRNRINDLCFTIDDKFIILVEHQSTINENMPLRFLIYVAREYEKILDNHNIYKKALIKIPTPEFIVLYNGRDKFPSKKTLQLSDAFKIPQDNPVLNLKTEVININYNENTELVNRCEKLKGYSYLIYLINSYLNDGYGLEKSINKAADKCINEGVLADYLRKNMSEVFNMLTTEWDFEEELKVSKQEAREKGLKEGLITTCQDLGLSYDNTLKKLMDKYSLKETNAKELMDKYWK